MRLKLGTSKVSGAQDQSGGVEAKKTGSLSTKTTVWFRLLLSPGYTSLDILLLVNGLIFSIAAGVPFPLLGILFGQLINSVNESSCANATGGNTDELQSGIRTKVLDIIYVTIANWCFLYIQFTCWSWFGERLVRRLRERYLRSLLRQELAFFDELPAGDVSSRLSNDLEQIQQGTSEKVGIVLSSISYFVAAYIVAFLKSAKLAGILVSLVPAYFLMSFGCGHYTKKYSSRVSDEIAKATSIASESLNKVHIVHAFGAARRLEARFADYVGRARSEGVKKAVVSGVELGLLFFIAYSTNAVAYWQGSHTIASSIASDSGATAVGAVYTVIFVLIDASFILSRVAPFMQIFATAAVASEKLNKAISRESAIDGTEKSGGRYLSSGTGAIEFENVSFAYPSRPETLVIKDLSMSIPAYKHTAIVGQSGSGKSTVAALFARLYDPTEGVVKLSGVDVRELNVRHLRGQFGAVQQDPALLDRSILENIAQGLINSEVPEEQVDVVLHGPLANFAEEVRKTGALDKTLLAQSPAVKAVVERVMKAAAIADATAFINRLDHGIATLVGAAGNQFSGGQKQRIALARAMVRDPKILLLDEATSALDSRSERLIQGALDEASKGRTTISIVHRLSTVKHADNIIVMRSGKILEQGTHAELIEADGAYASMVRLQTVSRQDESEALGLDNSRPEVGGISSANSSTDTIAEKEKDANEDDEELSSPAEPLPGEINRTMADPNPNSTDKGKRFGFLGRSKKEKKDEKDKSPTSNRGVLSTIRGIGVLTRSQALYLLVAFTASAVVGGSYSGEAVIFGHTVSSFSSCNTAAAIRSAGSFWGLLFFVLALIEFFGNLIMSGTFGLVGENTLYKVRILAMRTLLGQDVDWHESGGRDAAGLLSYVTSDTQALAGLTGTVLGTLFSVIINSIAGIALSLIVAWRIAVVLLACVPVLLGAGAMRLRCYAKFHEKHAKAFSSATGYATEAVNSIRVISTFSLEEEAVNVYHRSLQAPYKETLNMLLVSNAWLASAYSISNLVYALAYWWGSQNVIQGRYSQEAFFIVLPAMLFSAQTCGQLFALAPDFSKSKLSAARLLDLIDTGKEAMTVSDKAIKKGPYQDDESTPEEDVEKAASIKQADRGGMHVQLQEVEFAYPSRSDTRVLKGLDVELQPGQFGALVGPSGAGKSTIISLIERFYRPSAGKVKLDGRNVSDFTTAEFRNDIALVPQESVLFEGTLKFNLSLGARPDQEVTDLEIEEACKMAHIHETIMQLPQKYETKCGPNGNQFSGGQRQRLSIARALLRKPRLLLLDESTAALDSESEKLVQEALEEVRHGITVIAIAHRLHTIEKADRIFVVEDGRCTARGTHRELLRDSETYRTNALHQVLGD